MTKRILAVLLAAVMLLTLAACGGNEEEDSDTVINIDSAELTYTDENGDIFTYEYISSTTIAITSISGNYEPHTVVIPAQIRVNDESDNGNQSENLKDVVAIGEGAFRACSYISGIQTTAKLTSIGDFAFADCASLVDFVLPDTIETLGRGAFYGCNNMKTIHLSNALTEIGDCCFFGCTALTEIALPDSVVSLGDAAFLGCSSLASVTLNENLTSIGAQAFYGCTALKEISIPAGVTSIGDYAFATLLKESDVEGEESAVINTVEGSYAAEYISKLR